MDLPVRVVQSDDLSCGIVLVVLREAYASGNEGAYEPKLVFKCFKKQFPLAR
jgi:hypothetical protein